MVFDEDFYEGIVHTKSEFEKMSVDQQIGFSALGNEGNTLTFELCLIDRSL